MKTRLDDWDWKTSPAPALTPIQQEALHLWSKACNIDLSQIKIDVELSAQIAKYLDKIDLRKFNTELDIVVQNFKNVSENVESFFKHSGRILPLHLEELLSWLIEAYPDWSEMQCDTVEFKRGHFAEFSEDVKEQLERPTRAENNERTAKEHEKIENSIVTDDHTETELKAKDKLRYLIALDVIDWLHEKQPFDMSINKLAEVVAKITGENQTTMQPYLSAYFDKRDDNKNPTALQSNGKDPMQPIKDRLYDIGFKPKSS